VYSKHAISKTELISAAEHYLQFLGEYKKFQIDDNSLWELGEIVNNDVRFEPVVNGLAVIPFSEYLQQWNTTVNWHVWTQRDDITLWLQQTTKS